MFNWISEGVDRRNGPDIVMLFALALAIFIQFAGVAAEAAPSENSATTQQLEALMRLTESEEARRGVDLQCEQAGQLVRAHFRASPTYDSAFATFPSLKPYSETQESLCRCLIEAMIARVDGDSSLQWLIADIGRYTGMNPDLVLMLLETMYDSLYPFEHVWWGPEAHESLKQLSANNALGNFESGPGWSVREHAWTLRMRIYNDTMPEADALTMDSWRTHALLDVYNRYYLYAWFALLPLALLMLKYGRSPKTQCFLTLAYPIPLVGVLFVISIIASIGHNNANTKGMLYVWRHGFWIFFGTVALAYLFGLRHLWRARSNRLENHLSP